MSLAHLITRLIAPLSGVDRMASAEGGPETSWTGGAIARHYVNHVQVSLSLSEFRFDLTAVGAREPNPPSWRFVTTPDRLHVMHQDLGAALDRYRLCFGAIPAPVVTPTVEEPAADRDG